MGRLVIACYRPKPGKENDLIDLAKRHHPELRRIGLVTDRRPVIMQAKDGSIVEVFEWRSPEAIEKAHAHPEVKALWDRFAACCDYVPVAQVEEAGSPFSEFTPIDL